MLINLLYLCHCLPYPPDKGDRVRAFHQLRVLSREHTIHLVAFAKPDEALDAVSGLDEFCESIRVFPLSRLSSQLRGLAGLLGRQPLTHRFFYSRPLVEQVRATARSGAMDGVIAYSSAMAPYATLVPKVPRLLDMVDVDSEKWDQYARVSRPPKKWVYGLEANRLRRYESRIGEWFDQVVVATDRERDILREISPQAVVTAIRNGVDADFFSPQGTPKSSVPTLVFTGQMDYLPNVDAVTSFAHEVFPRLRQSWPDLQFLVVGRAPSAEVRALAELPGISVTGAVKDIRPYLEKSWIFIAPLRISQGVQNKVLEAMAMELPVVVSPVVHAGLTDGGFAVGHDLLVAEQDRDFEQAIARLVQNNDLRRELGEIGRERVLESYSWDQNCGRLAALIRRSETQPADAGRAPSLSVKSKQRA